MRILRLIPGIIIITGIIVAFSQRAHFNSNLLQQWLKEMGFWAPLVFVGVYSLSTVLFLPGSVLTITGGVLFGPLMGTVYNLAGATCGAVCAFMIARTSASSWVHKRVGGRIKVLINGIEQQGWLFVVFVRLVPLFPFNLLNYALGLTRIRLKHYILATVLGMVPGSFVYTYIGYAGREAMGGAEGIPLKIIVSFSLLVLLIFIPFFIKRMKKEKGISEPSASDSVEERNGDI